MKESGGTVGVEGALEEESISVGEKPRKGWLKAWLTQQVKRTVIGGEGFQAECLERNQDERARRENPRALLFSLPVREDALGWLPASCVSITSGSGLNQKCPNMLLKRTQSTCSGGWTVLGVLCRVPALMVRALQQDASSPHCSIFLHPGRRIWSY